MNIESSQNEGKKKHVPNERSGEKLPMMAFKSLEIIISANEVLEYNTETTVKLVPSLEGSECSLAGGLYINICPVIHFMTLN